MMDFNHPNVLTLIAVTIEKDVPKVILPFMINGDLRSFLIKYQEVIIRDNLHLSFRRKKFQAQLYQAKGVIIQIGHMNIISSR